MRDLGLMGESLFSKWCAESGMIANASQIDKTGWDYLVEFAFHTGVGPTEIHNPAFECKVQVKATDKNNRKRSVTLSNLRRLITVPMPAFFIFIEFDGSDDAQRAFVVHVDNDLISKVLKRLHKTEQSDKENHFNKRTMTIHYSDSHMIQNLNGKCLKEHLISYIGNNMAEYVSQKKSHLESTGFEDGAVRINVITRGDESIKNLIDSSLGIQKQVEVAHFKGTHVRFGIANKIPFIDTENGTLSLSPQDPYAKGILKIKKDRLSVGLSFESRLYISPLNKVVSKELRKMRIESDFFDIIYNPHTGNSSWSFSFASDIRLDIRKLRDTLKLFSLFTPSEKNLIIEMIFDGLPKTEFRPMFTDQIFDFSKELETIESAVKLLSDFDINNNVEISFDEVLQHQTRICQMRELIGQSPNRFRIEFKVNGKGFDTGKKIACILLTNVPIGSHILGMVIVVIGKVKEAIEQDVYRLSTEDFVIEKRISSKRGELIKNEDLVAVIETIEKKYDESHSVVTMFDKNINNDTDQRHLSLSD